MRSFARLFAATLSMQEIKFDFDDIKLVPADSSVIKSRKSVNTKVRMTGAAYRPDTLPLMSAPMDSVVSATRDGFNPVIIAELIEAGIRPVVPRNTQVFTDSALYAFGSLSLEEVKNFLGDDISNSGNTPPTFICIDMANGHMAELAATVRALKTKFPTLVLMVGNVANPYTYKILSEAGADYVRCGIGNGSGCLTTQQTGVGYPMASLIHECAQFAAQMDAPAKIVADGGFNKYADIIKALALGADYVMMGGLLSKMIESDSVPYLWKRIPVKNRRVAQWLYEKKAPLYKKFRGMSTKEVQREWQKTASGEPVALKTSEGITKWNRVENSLLGWVENFEAYLRSAMSYSNARDLQEFRENSSFVQITNHSQTRFKK